MWCPRALTFRLINLEALRITKVFDLQEKVNKIQLHYIWILVNRHQLFYETTNPYQYSSKVEDIQP